MKSNWSFAARVILWPKSANDLACSGISISPSASASTTTKLSPPVGGIDDKLADAVDALAQAALRCE